MPALIQPLPRSKFASATLEFQDADAQGKPLPHAQVRVELLHADGKLAGTLFQGRTNAEGKVSVRIPAPKAVAGEPPKPLPKIRISVLDLDGDVLKKLDVQPEADKPIPPIKVSDEPQKMKILAPLDDGTPVLGRKLSLGLSALLKQHKVDSLATLRTADSKPFASLLDQDKRDWAELSAHAQLQLVSRNHKVNQALVKAGYSSVLDIARRSRSEFTTTMKGKIPEDAPVKLHGTARRQVQVLGNLHTEEQARSANGMAASTYGGPAVEPPCECNCGSAVSPQAYLVDLLDYAVDNVRFDGNTLDLPRLETTFGQPFAALPVDCAFASLLVRQVRLCVEVLHRRNELLADNAVRAAAVTRALAAHAPRSYEALLRGLGTSYRELRLVRSDDEAKERLAERLGIKPDHVDRFRLELNSTEVDKQLSEDHLERLFGLQGTARDPLSTGAKFNDEQSQIARWQLRGVEWRKNTDDLGRIHVSVVKQPSGMHEIILFKRPARSQLNRLAMGSSQQASGEVELVAENYSGLAGRIEFNYRADDVDIFLAVVPEWAIRRKDQLRTLWQEIDHPASPFDVPIVDPDVVTEADLMLPFDKNDAHKLWKERKDKLQGERDALDKDAQDKSLAVSDMLEDMFGSPQDQAAWDAISAGLKSATPADVAAGEASVHALNPHLTSETFRFLLELWHRESDNRKIETTEREQALDVLVNIHKRRMFAAWKDEETNKRIRLSPPCFLLADGEPVLNPLRATAAARGNWRAELERNSAMPLIDPDIISESNFAPGVGSATAIQKWEDRRRLVGDGRRSDDNVPPRVEGDLFKVVANINSWAKLKIALTSGGLPAGPGSLFHTIGFTSDEVGGILKAFEKGATLPITPEQYGLTTAELRALVEVQRLGAGADDNDWGQVHHILVQAEKRRYLYPRWRREERDSDITLNPDVFHLPSDALAEFLPLLRLTTGFLQWRRDVRRQRAWREQLKARIEQERVIEVELQTAIDAAEEASLPALRDDLVMAMVLEGESLEERKRWVMNHLLINAFENGCRKATRVAQAIETIQLLLWGIHSRQLEVKKYSLESASAETFTEEWQWLGSYATWRSAMFTYLYPENLLLPELRQAIGDTDTDPTRLFQAILKVLSGLGAPSSDGEESAGAQTSEDRDSLVQIWVDRIYVALDQMDPTLNEAQARIFRELPQWRTSSAFIFPGDSNTNELLFDRTHVRYLFHPTENTLWWTYIQQRPNVESNPMLVEWRDDYVRSVYEEYLYTHDLGPDVPTTNNIACWSEYLTESAFMEDVLYIPLVFALTQFKRGNFDAALYWFGKVYDFRGTPPTDKQGWTNSRLELYVKQRGVTDSSLYVGLDDWLNDNLNPHLIAATRTGADVRFVILTIIRCLLEYADSEFSQDTSESLARARELYETARRLLDSKQLGKELGDCKDAIGTLISEIGKDEWIETVWPELDLIQPPFDPDSLRDNARDRLLNELKGALKPTNPPKPRSEVREEVHGIVGRHFAPRVPKTLEKSRLVGNKATLAAYQRLLTQPQVFRQVQRIGSGTFTASPLFMYILPKQGGISDRVTGHWDRAPRFEFCIPRNPLIDLLRLRFEVSWFKLNNCMNLAGQHREVPAYAAPTDTYSGLPVVDISSTAGFSAAARFVPTFYRYRVLIERAKQLVAMAQQMEATYLSFLEKRDLEDYNIRKARQDLGIARATVTLQDLRVTEAEDGEELAQKQWNRANEAFTYYARLIESDLSDLEKSALQITYVTMLVHFGVAAARGLAFVAAGFGVDSVSLGATFGTGSALATFASAALEQTIYQGVTSGLSTLSSFQSMQASNERRVQEWNFQKDMAEIDQDIAVVQQTLAEDRYDITVQEKRISEMSAENASDVVNFLNTKFTNIELYTWMGGIVGSIYRYLLQEATTIAKLAQRQLAFERQETELAVVLDDYWTYTDTSAILRGGSQTTDRRGMTGSARLLQDLTRLDQEAFLTDRRKLQLSKTFSLALHDPIAFARFQESGVLLFSTTLKQFDRNFPGHYLRLIKRVRVSVIALVPPTEGIRATLTSTGISWVVRGGDTFVETEIRRDPESIAFTSPINATGLFELQEQPEMLLPFEGNGVAATGWVFTMPRAANIVDFSTIADVLLTIDYTALESTIYRGQVIQQLDRTASGKRPFSFRHQFADCWYDLNNPDLVESDRQMCVTFETRRSDFPPNVTDLSIEHVSLYFLRQDGFTDSIHVEHLLFTESGRAGQVGGAATTNNGLISTSEANAGSWLPMKGKQPIGKWDLNLLKPGLSPSDGDEVKGWFKNGKIEDILFVVTYSGSTPDWPA